MCLPRLDFRGIAGADTQVCPYTDSQTDLVRWFVWSSPHLIRLRICCVEFTSRPHIDLRSEHQVSLGDDVLFSLDAFVHWFSAYGKFEN